MPGSHKTSNARATEIRLPNSPSHSTGNAFARTALFPHKPMDGGIDGVGNPDVAFRADRNHVGFAELAEALAGLSRGGKHLAIEVQAQNLAGESVDHMNVSIADLKRTRQSGVLQFLQIVPVLIEDLDSLILAIGDPEPSVGVDGDPVGNVELAGTFAFSAPGLYESPVPVELHDARISIGSRRMPLSDEYIAAGADGDVGWLVDLSRLSSCPQCQQDPSLRTYLVDDMSAIVRRPHVAAAVEFQSVSSSKQTFTESPDELPVGVEFRESLRAAVQNPEMPAFVEGHAVGCMAIKRAG